jgi:hypothetical protein
MIHLIKALVLLRGHQPSSLPGGSRNWGVSLWASACWIAVNDTHLRSMLHSRISELSSCWRLRLLLICSSILIARASSSVATTLVDATGRIVANDASTSGSSGLVTIVTSPGMTSTLIAADIDKDAVVSVLESGDTLVCRGCTLSDDGTAVSTTSHQALAACSSISQCLVLEGITLGDVQVAAGLRQTRHARTLSALFRARAATLAATAAAVPKQVLVLAVSVTENEPLDDDSSVVVVQQVRSLFQAATFGFQTAPKNLEDWYDLRITPISSSADAAVSVRCVYTRVVSRSVPVHT